MPYALGSSEGGFKGKPLLGGLLPKKQTRLMSFDVGCVENVLYQERSTFTLDLPFYYN